MTFHYHIYTDAGLIRASPSPYGGTFAYVTVNPTKETILTQYAGIVPLQYYGQVRKGYDNLTIGTNTAELYALLFALARTPQGWAGTVHCDNENAIKWVFYGQRMKDMPELLKQWRDIVLNRMDITKIKSVLLDGHPTRVQLETGIGKRGRPVSKYNVLCDALCTEQAQRYCERYCL